VSRTATDGCIFLTGAAGVVGQALLAELDAGDGPVLCLRHKSALPIADEAQIAGDLQAPRLGLSGPAFRELAKRVRCVVHAGAETRWTRTSEEIAQTNQHGTETMLELAALADAQLHYVGTAFAVADDRPVAEPGRADGSAPLGRGLSAYLASKRAADRLVTNSRVPGTVIRPSYIVGDASSGVIARFQGLYRIVSLALRNMIPAVPVRADAVTDFVPQDLVARSLAAVVRTEAREGCLWITAGERALHAGEFLDVAMRLAAALGIEADRPRLMAPDVIERLIRPVFLARLPPEAHEMFDEMLGMTALLGRSDALPSSLEDVERRFGVSTAFDPRAALEHSLRYWAEQKGLAQAETARR
jgi:nucleoside-diphosphate-sugar epimerase